MSRTSGIPRHPAAEVSIFERIDIHPDPDQVLRYMGYPQRAYPGEKVLARVRHALEASSCCIRPQGAYALHEVVPNARRLLVLAGGETFTGRIGEYLGGVTRVAVFVATAGPAIVARANDAMAAGDAMEGLVLNAIGSHVADAAVAFISQKLRAGIPAGENITLPFSPGYCGIPLAQQRKIFRLVDATAIGVELLPAFVMRPVKSMSGLIGIGPADSISASENPCQRCSLVNCEMRR